MTFKELLQIQNRDEFIYSLAQYCKTGIGFRGYDHAWVQGTIEAYDIRRKAQYEKRKAILRDRSGNETKIYMHCQSYWLSEKQLRGMFHYIMQETDTTIKPGQKLVRSGNKLEVLDGKQVLFTIYSEV